MLNKTNGTSMYRPLRSTLIAILIGLVAPLSASAAETGENALKVYSYASQVNDVDSVNSHWFETEEGVVLIDAQRLLPEAERALRHLRATTDKPVVAIVVSHAHTDHYGGLPVWLAAYPDATVYTDETTLSSIKNDGRGFIEMRNERHGERFPTQAELNEAVAEAEIVKAGDRLEIGEQTLVFDVLGPSEAESTVLVTIEDANVAFIGDLINVGMPAVPFENIDNWFEQLDGFDERFGTEDRLHIGHGPSPVGIPEIGEQRRFLTALRDGVSEAIADDSVLDAAETDAIVFNLEAGWPFYEGVAGNTRQEVLGFAASRVAQQLGATVSASAGND